MKRLLLVSVCTHFVCCRYTTNRT